MHEPHAAPLPEPRVRLHVPFFGHEERARALEALAGGVLQGGGEYTRRVEELLRRRFGSRWALVHTSCSHAMETVFAIHGLGPQDEVVVPSYTHPSTANAVIRQGARVVYADVFEDGPHADPADVERRIGPRTRAVVAVHYGGVSRGLRQLEDLCRERDLALFEDAAQAFDALDAERPCGTIGRAGCISFHGTKNLGCGEGGLLLSDDDELGERATTMREMGTDRARFRAGKVQRYTWQSVGSSFLPSDLLMAILLAQLEKADEITARTRAAFERYMRELAFVEERGRALLPRVPAECRPNGHVFHLLFPSSEARDACSAFLAARAIDSATHFEPLDTSPMGRRYAGTDPLPNTRRMAQGLLRLPLHAGLDEGQQARVIQAVEDHLARS